MNETQPAEGMQTLIKAARAVTRLGGGTLPDRHTPELIEEYTGKARGGKTSGCGRPHRGALPYMDHNEKQQFATVCVECDGIYMTPRVSQEMRNG